MGWLLANINGELFTIENFNNRFTRDKISYENDRYLIISDGVILNKNELIQDKKELSQLILDYLEKGEHTFFKNFIGPFNGAYLDKRNDIILAWGNQTGDSAIFYYFDENRNLIVSNDFNMIYNEVHNKGLCCEFNDEAGFHILSFGYIADDSTFIKKIRRLQAGKYLRYHNGSISVKEYHRFNKDNIDENITMKDAVETVDRYFRLAVKRCFDKDLEYGYKAHLSDLSGGLDSRMTTWVAHEMGYKNIVNLHYSQSMSLEYKYCSEIAKQLGHELYIKNLDDASFILDIEEMVYRNYGMSYYAAITGGNQMLKSLNFDRFGLEHTGQLGGLLGGAYINTRSAENIDEKSIKYSQRIPFSIDTSSYSCHELMALYVRGFNGILASHYLRKDYTYAVSPFLDPDFIQVYLGIPESMRAGHKLYLKWIATKYPDALKFKSTRNKFSFIKRCIRKTHAILTNTGLMKPYADYANMNPFDYWYKTNGTVYSFINSYYHNNISILKDFPDLLARTKQMFDDGNTIEKLMALTVIAAKKLYC